MYIQFLIFIYLIKVCWMQVDGFEEQNRQVNQKSFGERNEPKNPDNFEWDKKLYKKPSRSLQPPEVSFYLANVEPEMMKSIDSSNQSDQKEYQAFSISDPSSETQSFDSLRSVLMKSGKTHQNDNKINKQNLIKIVKSNRLKTDSLRGNRKYQLIKYDNDEMSYDRLVNKNSWTNFSKGSSLWWRMRTKKSKPRKFNNQQRFICPNILNSQIYIADRTSRCQVFYVCYGSDQGIPMVCPSGTLFNEEHQVCDWSFNVKCPQSFYN